MTSTTPPAEPGPVRHRTRQPKRRLVILIAGTIIAAAIAGTITALATTTLTGSTGHNAAAAPAPDGYQAPAPAATAELPAAVYDAVIPGLVPWQSTDVTGITRAATLTTDAPLYGRDKDREDPVGRMLAKDFLDQPTVIVPVQTEGRWTLVLTPARVQLPSKVDGNAAAQSAGWVRTDLLQKAHTLDAQVSVSVAKQTLTITRGSNSVSYPVGVGTDDAPTPTGVTGYLQARYLDPKQGQSTYPIQLTSLHSAAEDEPYKGTDGGLIGAHYASTATGAVSHGCIRLTHAATAAMNQLPLGTTITITG
jgi:hypothetical protein